MISTLAAKSFTAVPHLETSALMQTHGGKVWFSDSKPNVIVGPNGAGKSALLTALSLLTLAYYTGASAFDDHYVNSRESDDFWDSSPSWSRMPEFLPGLTAQTDNGVALYYRPGHIPGNDHSVAAAMATGYFEQARAYDSLVKHKSSGQQSRALLARLQAVLDGRSELRDYALVNWRFGNACRGLRRDASHLDVRAEALKARYLGASGKPVLLLDEPEQSLDARAQLELWTQLAHVDAHRVQAIVATHSLYPLMHPERFHLIEAVPGYAEEVKAML